MDVLFIDSTSTIGSKILFNNCSKIGLTCKSICSESYDQLERSVIKHSPKILAINWNFNETIYKFLCFSLKKIKSECKDITIIVHSYGASYDWKNLSEVEQIDYIVGGECDKTFPELCERILKKDLPDKLEYLKPTVVDLSDYDYENNYVLTNGVLILATSRNCVYSSKRCWYCPCYPLPYRRLDLEKIIDSLKRNVDFNKVNRITFIDAETPPDVINRFYSEFHKPIHAFILFKSLLKISDELKNSGSNLIFGSNIERPDKHSNVVYSSEVLDLVLDKVKDKLKGNCISTTILVESKEDEKNHSSLLEVYKKYPFINVNFCYLRKTPREFSGDEIKENIYLEYKRNPYVWFDCVTNLEDAI